MKNFSFLLGSAFLSLAVHAFATPFNALELRTVYNSGDSLTIRTIGDEYYSITQTADGLLVVCDSFNTFYYANENGEASKFAARNADKRSAAELAFINGIDQEKAIEAHHSKNANTLFADRNNDIEVRAGCNFASFVHEFSHTMGLQDYYCVRSKECSQNFIRKELQAPGAHAWDVMATGVFNGNGKVPPNYSTFERYFMGWLDETMLEQDRAITAVPPLHSKNAAYFLDGDKNDFFHF